MRYDDVVRAALKTDPEFVELCKTLYGAQLGLIAKDGPDPTDVHVPGNTGKKKKIPVLDNRALPIEKRTQVPSQPREFHRDDHGRFSSFAGAAGHATLAGLAGSASLVAGQKTAVRAKGLAELTGKLRATAKGRRVLLRTLAAHGGKTAGLAAVGGVAGAMAAHHGKAAYNEIQGRAALERRHHAEVKHVTRQMDLHEFTDGERTSAVVRTPNPGKGTDAQTTIRRKGGSDRTLHFGKRDVDMTGSITGINEDKHQVFGWASIIQKDGRPVVDLQGDYIGVDELEKAAYDYVQHSRIGGAMHARVDEHGNVIAKNKPYHAADLIESFVVTPEKIEKMGLPAETPVGWWVGFKVNDPDVWDVVKSGEWKGFSIHGSGRRTEKSLEDLNLTGAELTR